MTHLRVFIDGNHSGHENMAIDEALLEGDEHCVLRLYGWEPAALSLGHFQVEDERELQPFRDAGIDVVRRITGGGAILHAHELTYSLCGNVGEGPFAGGVEDSYTLVHEAWIRALSTFGVAAHHANSAPRSLRHVEQPFLCFSRSTKWDVIADGAKLIGSAKRERRGRALQHGSIVLRRHALGGPTAALDALAPAPIARADLVSAFARELAAIL